MKKIIYFFATVLMFLTFNACQKPDILQQEETEAVETTRTMNDLIVGENFDWKTTKDVYVQLNLSSTGTVYLNSTKGETFQKAYVLKNSEYLSKITIPTYMDKVEIIHSGTKTEVPIVDNKIQLTI
jgi:hypothetical protein